jgi:hypothetical protein
MILFEKDDQEFHEQECVQLGERLFGIGPTYATLLDFQAGKVLILLFDEFREPGTSGVLEVSPEEVFKQY